MNVKFYLRQPLFAVALVSWMLVAVAAEQNVGIGVIEQQLDCDSETTCEVSKREATLFRPLFQFQDGKWRRHYLADQSAENSSKSDTVIWKVFQENKYERDLVTTGALSTKWYGAAGAQLMRELPAFNWNVKKKMIGWVPYAWPRIAISGSESGKLLSTRVVQPSDSRVWQAGVWWQKEFANSKLRCSKELSASFSPVRLRITDFKVEPYIVVSENKSIFRVIPRESVAKKCDVPHEEDSLSDQWYEVVGTNAPKSIPIAKQARSNGFRVDTQFLLAGDFVGDNTNSVVFRVSGYNEDGYVLYDLKSERMTTFVHGYH